MRTTSGPLFETLLERIPPPLYEEGHPLQAHVTNLDASPYLGRLALCRVREGTIRKGQQVAWCRADGRIERVKVTELYVTDALDRVDAEEAGPGELIAVAGIPEVTIGETLADPDDPRPLPVMMIDEPSLSMTIGTNTAPLAGQDGTRLTATMVKARLDQELIGNVSLRVLPTERPDAWEVQGRGELQLAVLVELMRREGFELTVGKPQVVTREVDGKVHEPMERLAIDAPEDYVGVITQLLALRKGRMEHMVNHGTGWVRMEYLVPARGLIGFRTEFLTETRGTGILHHVFEGYEPWHGELRTRPTGSLVADRRGPTTAFALFNLQERGQLFVAPGVEVYEGMVVGENARAEDLDVNPTKEKKLTNMRSSTSDELVRLIPPRPLSLEQALEFIREDECVEVTPTNVRLRKVELTAQKRATSASRKARGLADRLEARLGSPHASGVAQARSAGPLSRARCVPLAVRRRTGRELARLPLLLPDRRAHDGAARHRLRRPAGQAERRRAGELHLHDERAARVLGHRSRPHLRRAFTRRGGPWPQTDGPGVAFGVGRVTTHDASRGTCDVEDSSRVYTSAPNLMNRMFKGVQGLHLRVEVGQGVADIGGKADRACDETQHGVQDGPSRRAQCGRADVAPARPAHARSVGDAQDEEAFARAQVRQGRQAQPDPQHPDPAQDDGLRARRGLHQVRQLRNGSSPRRRRSALSSARSRRE